MAARSRHAQRGAALVEFALIAPLFLMLVFGMLDYGMVFRDYLTVANTTRAGARVGSAAGKSATADYDILKAVASASGALPASTITRIIVFRSDASGTMNPACNTSAVTNTASVKGCNVYSASDMALSQTALANSGKSNFWLPTTRVDAQSGAGSDYVGIYLKVNHEMVTHFFGNTFTLTDKTVMRIEPTVA
jgi:Flp pilus assembly protein TadG